MRRAPRPPDLGGNSLSERLVAPRAVGRRQRGPSVGLDLEVRARKSESREQPPQASRVVPSGGAASRWIGTWKWTPRRRARQAGERLRRIQRSVAARRADLVEKRGSSKAASASRAVASEDSAPRWQRRSAPCRAARRREGRHRSERDGGVARVVAEREVGIPAQKARPPRSIRARIPARVQGKPSRRGAALRELVRRCARVRRARAGRDVHAAPAERKREMVARRRTVRSRCARISV